MSDTPETDALREAIDNGAATEAEMTSLAGKLEQERDEAERENEQLLASNKTYERDWPVLVHERNKALRCLEFIAEDCEAWLNSECEEPSMDFIKAVRDYARKAING